MCQRKRYGVVLLLVTGLASLPSRPAPAQVAPSGWTPPGGQPAVLGGPPQVIATTKQGPPPPVLTGDSRLPPPDDGLAAPGTKGPAKEVAKGPPLPPVLPEIREAGYVAPPPVRDNGLRLGSISPERPAGMALLDQLKDKNSASVGVAGVGDPGRPPLTSTPKGGASGHLPGSPTPATPTESGSPRSGDPKWQDAASLSVLVVGPDNAMPGQPVACQIQIKNGGPRMLAEVGVALPIPAGTRVVSIDPEGERRDDAIHWALGNLQPGQIRVVRFEVQSSEPGEVHLHPRATFSPGGGLRTAVVRPPFSLEVTGPEKAALGEKVVFTVKVGNHTGSPISNVNLLGKLSEGLAHPSGNELTMDLGDPLQPNQVKSIPIEVAVRTAGKQQIEMTATGFGGHRGQASWAVAVAEPGLALVQGGPRQANVGEVLSYRLEVRNPGRTPAGPVRLTQALPEGVGFNSASEGGMFEIATQSIVWTLPALQPGEMRAVTFSAQGRKPGDWALPASAGAAGVTEARSTHAVRIDATPAASLTLETQDHHLAVNGETICSMRLYNQGPNAMRDARLVVTLPEALDVVGIEGPTRWQQSGKQIAFEPLAELRPRVDAIYRIRVRVASGADATIRAELHAAGMEQPRQAFRAIQITAPVAGR